MANENTPPSNDTRFKPKPALVSPAQDPDNFDIDNLEKRLKLIQLQRLEREEALIAEAETAKIIARQAGIDSVKSQMAQAKAKQANCNHLKENSRTHLAGQKDHSGIINLICQRCQKQFIGNQIPPHLFPNSEFAIGGPQ